MAKLTLNIEPETIETAKKFAKQKHTSISKMVQSYLKGISQEDGSKTKANKNIAPEVMALTGILKDVNLPEDSDYRQAYREHLEKKHGL